MSESRSDMLPKSMHEIQVSVLKSLGYRGKKTFSELQGGLPSNKLSFHLNKLNEKGIIEKNSGVYQTTEKGKSVLADLKFGGVTTPIDELMIIVRNKNDGVFLKYIEDNMDPLAGSYRPLVNRLVKNERLEDKTSAIVEEEVGCPVDSMRFIGILDMKTLFGDERFQHYLNLVVMVEVDATGEDFWELSELSELELIPGLEDILARCFETEKLPFMGEWDLKSTENGFELDKLEI